MPSIARVKVPSSWWETEEWRIDDLRDAGYEVCGDEAEEAEVEYVVSDEIAFEDIMCEPGPADSLGGLDWMDPAS